VSFNNMLQLSNSDVVTDNQRISR